MKRRKNWSKYSDEELLDLLVDLGKELAQNEYRKIHGEYKDLDIKPKEPTVKDLKEAEGYPSPSVYIKRFGSWSIAKYLAGFTESFENPYAYSREELIDYLAQETGFSREFAAKLLSNKKI